MKTPSELRIEAKGLREYALTLFRLNHVDIALGKLMEATRRETYAELLEGKREILKACVARQKSQPGPTNRSAPATDTRPRAYILKDTGGIKANCDFLTRMAYQRIAQRQIEKPYRKPLVFR
jgi:hypothetical protein